MGKRVRDQKQYLRKWYQNNAERQKAKAKEWKKQNPEKVRLSRQKNTSTSREYMRGWRNENRQYLCVHSAKKRCQKTGVVFDLDREWVDQTYTGFCSLTGIPFETKGTRSPYAVSLDRIDTKKGYTKDNCRFILFGLNAFKGSGTDNDMITIAKMLVEKNMPRGFKP